MGVFLVGLACLALLGPYSLLRVRREFGAGESLSPLTVTAVWTLYGLHGALTLLTAAQGFWPLPLPRLPTLALGFALALLGTGLFLGGIIEFRSLRRLSGRDTSLLVTSGVYRYSRNPQNTGWGLFLLGAAVAGRSGLALLLAGLFWISFRLYLPSEERYLEGVFGEVYRRYCARVSRFLGRPGKQEAA